MRPRCWCPLDFTPPFHISFQPFVNTIPPPFFSKKKKLLARPFLLKAFPILGALYILTLTTDMGNGKIPRPWNCYYKKGIKTKIEEGQKLKEVYLNPW